MITVVFDRQDGRSSFHVIEAYTLVAYSARPPRRTDVVYDPQVSKHQSRFDALTRRGDVRKKMISKLTKEAKALGPDHIDMIST